MNWLLNSIGKKIILIILLSVISIFLLVFVSVTFFGKIREIGGISKSAFQLRSDDEKCIH